MHQRHVFLLVVLTTYPGEAQIKESDFNNINKTILNIYQPLLAEHGAIVELNEIFQNFGGAFRVDSTLKYLGQQSITMTLTGAIPNNPSMNIEGYAIVACHEMGHILGGEPRQKGHFSKWSSVEGQADYFATNQCMWRFIEASPKEAAFIEPLCATNFNASKKIADCSRIIYGIKAMITYFNSSEPKSAAISLEQKDVSKVSKTLQKYPSAQCRVDTWVAGLLSQKRPTCWYAL